MPDVRRAPSATLSLLRFNGHFPGDPELAGVYWSKGWWRCWWQLNYWSYKSCKVMNLITTNKPTFSFFYRSDARSPSRRPTNSVKSLKGKISHSMYLLTPSSPGVVQLYLWPLITLGEGCHASHQPSDSSTPATTCPIHIIILTLKCQS